MECNKNVYSLEIPIKQKHEYRKNVLHTYTLNRDNKFNFSVIVSL